MAKLKIKEDNDKGITTYKLSLDADELAVVSALLMMLNNDNDSVYGTIAKNIYAEIVGKAEDEVCFIEPDSFNCFITTEGWNDIYFEPCDLKLQFEK